MTVNRHPSSNPLLHWKSLDDKGQHWFEAEFVLPELRIRQTSDSAIAKRLQDLFAAIDRQQAGFWEVSERISILTRLEFPRLWGLGTSSTLIANLALWSGADPFQMLEDTFTGSGYDIACGLSAHPLLYQLHHGRPHFVQLPYQMPFSDQLYFVYLEKKQDSRMGITRYREKVKEPGALIQKISELSLAMVRANKLEDFEYLIDQHENLVSEAIELDKVKDLYFGDYWGETKSLGAWGGDFVLATSKREPSFTRKYFNERGYSDVFSYEELLM